MFRHASLSLLLLSLGALPVAADHAPAVKAKGEALAVLRSAKSGPWSVAATWEGGKVPGAGARVQIREGHVVVYDTSTGPAVRAVHVARTLTFARDRDTTLEVGVLNIQAGEALSEGGFCFPP